MEASCHHKEASSDEFGEYRCSDLDLPVFTPDALKPVFSTFLCNITSERWLILADGNIDTHTIILLTNMCQELVEEISILVLQVVAPQVIAWVQFQSSLDSATCSTDICEKRNYYCVTEEDIQATIGDSLHHSFVEVLGVEQDWPQTHKLVELFAREVKKRVNHELSIIRGVSPSTQPEEPSAQTHTSETCDSPTGNMVYLIAHILKSATEVTRSPENQGNPHEVTEAQNFIDKEIITEVCNCAEKTDLELPQSPDHLACNLPEGCSPVELLKIENMEDGIYEPINDISVEQRADLVEHPAGSVEELPQQDKTFLIVVLGKLVEYIADSTQTSISEVDFDGILTSLKERTGGQLSFTLPKMVGKIHISIYKQLCQEFGSAKLLQAAMVSGDGAFVDALLEILKAQLQKSTGETCSMMKKIRRFFNKRTGKVSPPRDATHALDSHCVTNQENGSTHPHSNRQKRPAIIRMFSTVASCLTKPFTSCTRDW